MIVGAGGGTGAPVDIHKLAKLRELRFCSKSLSLEVRARAYAVGRLDGNAGK